MNITVFCGALPGERPSYTRAAQELGTWIARNGHTLVYGGSKPGLMGAVANSCLAAGGEVIGVSTQDPYIKDQLKDDLSILELLPDLAQRKSRLIELADAIIALPGGPGTLDEVSDVIVLARCGKRTIPCVLYSVDGYYRALGDFLAHMEHEGFSGAGSLAAVRIGETLDEVVAALALER